MISYKNEENSLKKPLDYDPMNEWRTSSYSF